MSNDKKNILVIMPKYFGYEEYIRKWLEKKYNVTMIYENMDEVSLIYRFIYVYLKKYKDYFMTKFYKKNITKVYDIVLVIRGASLTTSVMKYIKETSPNAKYYMYQWDSIAYNQRALEIAPFFEKISTFDERDAKDNNWFYRPLFYVCKSERECKRHYKICFIGSLHSQRAKVYNYISKMGLNVFLYMYAPLTHFIKQKFIKRTEEFKYIEKKDMKFNSISLEETQKVYSDSDIVVDFTRENQQGFTIRTIESIGHKCKLITNNKKILEADFYNPKNVYVYDIDNFHIPDNFINDEYEILDSKIYDKYSLDTFLEELL